MALLYASGEEIQLGDLVRYLGEPGEIEIVADPATPSLETDWYVQQFGSGVMVLEPKVFGRVFLSDTESDPDLVFVSRNPTSR